MGFIFAPPPQAVLPIAGDPDSLFPIRRVFHIGHNYAAHNKELGAPDDPVIFLKPVDAVVAVPEGQLADIPYPPMSENFQHEIELVAALKSGGRNLTEEQAAACIYGYAVGIDFTRRDWHFKMRDKGQPWEKGKTCDSALPITAIRKAEDVGDLSNLQIWLDVNGVRKQEGTTGQMMHSLGRNRPDRNPQRQNRLARGLFLCRGSEAQPPIAAQQTKNPGNPPSNPGSFSVAWTARCA